MDFLRKTKTELIKEIENLQKKINELENINVKEDSFVNNPNYYDSDIPVATDISNRKFTNENKLEKETIERALIDSVTESVIMQNIDGNILDLNKTAAERLGKTREELMGSNIYDLFPEDLARKRKEKVSEAVLNRKPVRFIDERDKKYFDSTIFPFSTNGDYEISKIIVFANDITDRINAIDAIRKSEERYRELVEHSPYAIFIHFEGKFVYSNGAGLRLLGFSNTEDLYGRNVMDFVHPDYRDHVFERISQVHSFKNSVPIIEEKFIKEDGSEVDVETTALPFAFKGKVAVQIISQDITKRKKIERELRENQRMLSTLIGNLPGIAYRSKNDKRRSMEFISDGCKELTGYPGSDLINNVRISYSDIIHKDDREEIWNTIQKAVNEKKAFALVYRIATSDRKERWVWEKGEGVYNENGIVVALEGFISDITEMKMNEDTIRKLSRAVEQSPASIVITDLDGIIEYVNPKFTETTGYRFEETIGRNPNILKSGENPNELYEDLWNTITSGNEWRGIFQNKKKDGSLFWEYAQISPVKNDSGKITHYLAVKEDITEKKTNDERLRNSLKEKELMLREIHHRVKNNLQIISSLLKLQSTYIKDETSLEYFRISQDRVKSMALIHQQLYRSRDLSSIDFGEYIRNLANHLLQAYGTNEKNISLVINADNIHIGIDSAIPCGLIINELISNSLKHAFPNNMKGKIMIKMILQEGIKYLLTISDNGIGFPDDIDYKNTKSLGMQLVITLTEQIDGMIELIRNPVQDRSNGTIFNITFNAINYLKRV